MDQWLVFVFPFLCVVLRTVGLFITAPVLGAKYIPAPLKAGLSLIIGFFMWPWVKVGILPETLVGLWVPGVGEIAFGLALGVLASLFMSAIELAGQIVDMGMGFGLANVVDPAFGQSVPIMGMFKYLVVTALFLALDGHHLFIKALFQSFQMVPAGTGLVPSQWAAIGLQTVSRMFWTAVMLSCPIWVSMLMVDVALGMVARSVPQMNVFVVGMPVKALVALGVMSTAVGFYGVFTKNLTVSLKSLMDGLLGVFSW